MTTLTAPTRRAGSTAAMGPSGPRRLLADAVATGSPTSLAENGSRYRRPPVPGRRPRPELIDAVERAGLRGRGGAGFPTATKWRAVAAGAGRPAVVVNGTEGEPASYKDRLLLCAQPHLVLDGAQLAAAAVGADRIFVCVDRTASAALRALRRAAAERLAEKRASTPLELVAVPPRFVAGEETALVHFLNGGPAKPTLAPPRPYQRGVANRPTLVQNVETLAHAAQIIQWGADWFRQVGTRDEPGTMLVSVSGAVDRPGVIEVPIGAPLRTIVDAARPSAPPAAALVGGFSGTWVSGADLDVGISRTDLAPRGAAPGCGVIVVLPEGGCGLAETARIVGWYGAESAGQCGPCVFGLPALADEAARICWGPVPAHGLQQLTRWASDVMGRGACRHPDGAVRLLRSALSVFAEDIDRHLRGQPCAGATAPAVIQVPRPGPDVGWR